MYGCVRAFTEGRLSPTRLHNSHSRFGCQAAQAAAPLGGRPCHATSPSPRLPGTHLAQRAHLVAAARDADHPHPHRLAELHRRQAHAARCPKHQQRLACTQGAAPLRCSVCVCAVCVCVASV